MAAKKQTYEQAMKRLEEIVSRIDSNELDIDSLGVNLKEAQELIKFCRDKLYKADEESAKDVVNDVFCSVLESNERLTTEEDLLPLFFVMVRNRCIDQIRHQNVVHKNAERYLEELYSGWTVKEYREYEDKINRM